jgi:hypothetical protein
LHLAAETGQKVVGEFHVRSHSPANVKIG